MDIREQIEELLTKEYGWFDPKKVDKLLNLHNVIKCSCNNRLAKPISPTEYEC